MFVLHVSNKTENLLAHLIAVIENAPLTDPLEGEMFLIQSQGMERWLAQQLAEHFKVFANFQFLFPGKFFSAMAQAVDLELNDQPFERNNLIWRLDAQFRELDAPEFDLIRHYVTGNSGDLKRYQLARQLAQVFDQYQIMRSDMLTQWQQGDLLHDHASEVWQALLWRKLTRTLGDRHRGSVWLETIERLYNSDAAEFSNTLPERINVFGLNTMPPLFLAFLQALSRHSQVHFYLLSPVQNYWADLPGRRIAEHTAESELAHHPLLISLGQQGREFQELLLEQTQFELEFDSFEASMPEQTNNLQVLQNDILHNEIVPRSLSNDGSISVHACHSRFREVQVLKDQLLHALEIDADLNLREIVVMAPDIQKYEPFINAVFSDISFAIADRSMRLNNTLLDLFLRFLHLTQSRFGWKEVLDFLQEPWIYSGFGLTEQDVQLIGDWVGQLNIRWGRSAIHKQQIGLPPRPENTWQSGLERLLMGYAIADDGKLVNGVLPFAEIEGSSALALGGLHDYLELMFEAAQQCNETRNLNAWSQLFLRYAKTLFSESGVEVSQLNQLYELINDIALVYAQCHQHPVSLDVMIAWLEDAIQEQKSSTGFLRGQLTFCSMLPMRSIPFKVIALLGMNEGEFPKIDYAPNFDLISCFFRKGDRSRRADDRYQFLEILLSARQQLIISYIGLSDRNNEKRPASVVVSELMDYLTSYYQLHDIQNEHLLHGFSPEYFNQTEKLFSYSAADHKIAMRFQQPAADQQAWWPGLMQCEPDEIVSIQDLMAFYRNPQKFFMQQRLNISGLGIKAEAEERELFELSALEQYSLDSDWLNWQLQGHEVTLNMLQAKGKWLSGAPGEISYAKHEQELSAFAEIIESKNLGLQQEELSLDLAFENFRLVGVLSGLYQHGSLFYRYTRLKGKDLYTAWLHHLIINRVRENKTYVIAQDQQLLLQPQDCSDQDLLKLLGLFNQGLSNAQALFVEPVFAYIQQQAKINHGHKVRKMPMDCAVDQLLNTVSEGYDPYLNLVLRGGPPINKVLDETFVELCTNTFLPLWEKTYVDHLT